MVLLVFLLFLSFSTKLDVMQIESHVKWLDEDLNQFAEDLKQGMEITLMSGLENLNFTSATCVTIW